MGIEQNLLKDLGSVAMTASELASIAALVRRYRRPDDFFGGLEALFGELGRVYDVPLRVWSPWLALNGEAAFTDGFEACFAAFKDSYLGEASRPRHHTEAAYECHLALKACKAYQTGFPLLRHAFGRLDDLVDKWVTNDAWLVMNVDGALKKFSRLLDELADWHRRDAEDAWVRFAPAQDDWRRYLALIEDRRRPLGEAGAERAAAGWMHALLG